MFAPIIIVVIQVVILRCTYELMVRPKSFYTALIDNVISINFLYHLLESQNLSAR